MKKILLLVGLVALAPPICAQADNISGDGLRNAVILLIRHAEKTGDDMGLSPEGQARANAYADYFKNFTVAGKSLKLDRLYSAAISKHSERCGLTLVPLSRALGLTVDGGYPIKRPEKLVAIIQQQPPGLHSLISWHHGSIPKLLTAPENFRSTHAIEGCDFQQRTRTGPDFPEGFRKPRPLVAVSAPIRRAFPRPPVAAL